MPTSALPFELTTVAATSWLQSLSKLNNVSTANHLNKAIKLFRNADYETDEAFLVLTELTPTILFISDDIESTFLSEESNFQNEKTQKIKKLCIQLLRNLSLVFCKFSGQEALSLDNQKLSSYFALQLLGLTQRLLANMHEFPSTSLWGKSSEIYIQSKENNYFDQELALKINKFKTLPNIESVLKRNLLFSILSPYQHTGSEIKELFLFSEQYANLLDFQSNKVNDDFYIWNTDNKSPPQIKKSNQTANASNITISTNKLLTFMESSKFSCSLDQKIQTKIIEKISGYQKAIHSFVPSPPNIKHFIVGVVEIEKYLEKINKLNKIQQLSSQFGNNKPSNNMSLEPMEFEKNHLDSALDMQANKSSDLLLQGTRTVKVLKTKSSHFVIAESNPIDYDIGELVVLCATTLTAELGIIRQIRTTNISGTLHLLIEKIAGTLSALTIEAPEVETKQVLLVENSGKNPEIFIFPSKFSNGTQLKLSLDQSFILDKLLDHSPLFMRYSTV